MTLDPNAKIPLYMVAEIAERAYRRGFQQGHFASETKRPVKNLDQWRYLAPTDKCIDPHRDGGDTGSPLLRLEMEHWQNLGKFLIQYDGQAICSSLK